MLASTDQRKKPMSLSFTRTSSTPWKTVALEIVEGLGKAVVLIVSTVAVVGFGSDGHVVAAIIVPQAMTLQEAKSIARHLGLTLRKVCSADYRVNFRDGNETTAYYTDSLQDAVNAAVEMARKRAWNSFVQR